MTNTISVNISGKPNTVITEIKKAQIKKLYPNNPVTTNDVVELLPDATASSILNGTAEKVESLNTLEVLPSDKLQFRVRFIKVDPVGFTANTPAPVGFAVIGVNNYIL